MLFDLDNLWVNEKWVVMFENTNNIIMDHELLIKIIYLQKHKRITSPYYPH